MMDEQTPRSSIPQLLKGIVHDLRTLLSHEIELARVESQYEINQARKAAIRFGIAGGLLAFAAICLTAALGFLASWAWQWPTWAGFGLVALVYAVTGGVFFLMGRSIARSTSLVPKATIRSVKDNVRWLKARAGF